MQLRDYRPEDFDAICQIDRLCFEPGISYDPEEVEGWLGQRGSFVLVAEDGAQARLAGFVLARRTSARLGHIITIDVLPEYRRSGIGKDLMQQAEHRLQAMGVRRIRLEVSVENQAALRFYEKLGYQLAGRIPRYYLDRIDAWAMQREL